MTHVLEFFGLWFVQDPLLLADPRDSTLSSDHSCRLGLRPLLGTLSRVVTMGTKKLGSKGPGFLRIGWVSRVVHISELGM